MVGDASRSIRPNSLSGSVTPLALWLVYTNGPKAPPPPPSIAIWRLNLCVICYCSAVTNNRSELKGKHDIKLSFETQTVYRRKTTQPGWFAFTQYCRNYRWRACWGFSKSHSSAINQLVQPCRTAKGSPTFSARYPAISRKPTPYWRFFGKHALGSRWRQRSQIGFLFSMCCRNFNWTFASLVYEDSEYGVKVRTPTV